MIKSRLDAFTCPQERDSYEHPGTSSRQFVDAVREA